LSNVWPRDDRFIDAVASLNYLVVVGGVLLVQAAISYATILAGTGNGSFVGLGAMILALYGIPATAILNFFLLRNQRRNPKRSNVLWVIVISSVLPVLQLALLIAQKALDL
jgi:hypothetical protein